LILHAACFLNGCRLFTHLVLGIPRNWVYQHTELVPSRVARTSQADRTGHKKPKTPYRERSRFYLDEDICWVSVGRTATQLTGRERAFYSHGPVQIRVAEPRGFDLFRRHGASCMRGLVFQREKGVRRGRRTLLAVAGDAGDLAGGRNLQSHGRRGWNRCRRARY